MGGGIGNMLGIDKMFGGLLDSIGLGALKPLVNVAFDFATGNIPGMIQDLSSMMKSFGDGNFTNNVANNQPLPEAFNPEQNEYGNTEAADKAENKEALNNCACREGNGDLSKNRIGDLFKLLGEIFSAKSANNPKELMTKLSELFKLLSENADNRQTIQDARTNTQFLGGNVAVA
jgi:hypothetical protein